MSTTLQQILGAKNLTGIINGIIGGVPEDLIPAGFMSSRRQVEGDYCTYNKVEATRKTARLVQYGSKAVKRQLQGVSEVPVKLAHFFESFDVKPTDMMNLLAEGNETRQRMGAATLARQVAEFGRLFRNNRLVAFYSMLARGKISYDSDGNFKTSDQAGSGGVDIDFSVPANNQNQWNGIIGASWATAGTSIITQVKAVKKQARKLTGYPLKHAFYGANIPDYLLTNTQLKELINRNARLQEAFTLAEAGEIPDGFLGFMWHPVDQAFWDDGGTNTDIFGDDALILTPEPSADWFEWIEGSYPVPTDIGSVSSDAVSALLSSIAEVYGAFSYATVTHNPVCVEGFAGDTVLPTLKVPGAIFIGDVTP